MSQNVYYYNTDNTKFPLNSSYRFLRVGVTNSLDMPTNRPTYSLFSDIFPAQQGYFKTVDNNKENAISTSSDIILDTSYQYTLFMFAIQTNLTDDEYTDLTNFISNIKINIDNISYKANTYSRYNNIVYFDVVDSNGNRISIDTVNSSTTWYFDFNATPLVSTVKVNVTISNARIYPTETEFNKGDTVTFTVYANDGYYFSARPTLDGNNMSRYDSTISTKTVTLNDDIEIVANAIKRTRFNVTNNLVNATKSPNDSWFTTYGEKKTFTVSPNPSYNHFTIPPTINGEPMQLYYTGPSYVYTDFEITNNITFEGKSDIDDIKYYTATVNISNCTLEPKATQFYDGQSVTFKVYANDGYSFYNIPTVDGMEMSKLSDTAYYLKVTPTKDFTVIANAEKPKIYHNATYNLTNCTITPNDTQIVEGEQYNYIIKANDGYRFDTTPTINGVEMGKVSDTEYHYTITINSDIVVNATANVIPIYTVITNLTNCSVTPTDTTVKDGDNVTYIVTANNGYEFNTIPTINNIEMEKISNLEYNYTITAHNNITITASADKILSTFTVTANLTNCTISPTTTQFKENSTQLFTITANNDYHFTIAPTVNIGTLTKIDDVSYNWDVTFTENATITATASELPKAKFIYGTLTNCTCNYENNEILKADKDIIFTANDGYYFDNYTITWVSSTGFVLSKTLNGTSATFLDGNTLNDYINNRDDISIGDVTAILQLLDVVNGVNLYSITANELVDLMNTRFVTESDDSKNDFGKYITNLYTLPFSISDIKGDETRIVLGYQSSGTTGISLRKNTIDVNLGNIVVPNYKSAYESDAKYRMYLPFIDAVLALDNEFIVGHTITVTYHIDLLSETLTLILSNESLELPFYYSKFKIGRNLPFFNTENGNTNLQYNNDMIYNTLYAYIIKTVNSAYNDNSEIGKSTFIYDVLNNYKGGYVECTNLKISDERITKEEKTQLDNLLAKGVYINEIS